MNLVQFSNDDGNRRVGRVLGSDRASEKIPHDLPSDRRVTLQKPRIGVDFSSPWWRRPQLSDDGV
jgi:hypothetical protein